MTQTERTVREIAIETPSTIRVFEALGIDYCCGGKRTLSDACERAGVPVQRAIDLLAVAGQPVPDTSDWNRAPLGALAAHIVQTHHGFVRRETPRMASLLTKVRSKHGELHPEIAQIEELFTALGQEMATHMLKEEQVLFPHIERMASAYREQSTPPAAFFGTVKMPIANMLADHDDAGALLARMRELSQGYVVPEGGCPTFHALYRGLEDFERDLHRHVHLENNILFPRAIEMERASAEAPCAAR